MRLYYKYLESLLGKREADKLITAIRAGKTILVGGPEGPTGKTTLCRVLQKAGASAIEKTDVYEVTVHEPLEKLTPCIENTISFEGEPKEIAALVLAVQERQEANDLYQAVHGKYAK